MVKGNLDTSDVQHPRKRFFRARAHSNPLNATLFPVPTCPSDVDWNAHFTIVSSPATVAAAAYDAAADAAVSDILQEAAPAEAQAPAAAVYASAPGLAAASTSSAADMDALAASTSGQPGADLLPRFADIGCGFGGLLIRLSPLYPETRMVGMELRDKVTNYVKERIAALRRQHPGQYGNVTCVRNNAMKHLPNFFRKEQLTKLFFLFPDPHFKVANHRRRIISTGLCTEYAHLLQPGGRLYTITDVPDLGTWMRTKLEAHPMFDLISDEELLEDPAAGLLTQASEEAQKVARNHGATFRAVFRRRATPRDV